MPTNESHPLADVITWQRARQVIYGLYVVVTVVVGAIQVAAPHIEWVDTALLVIAYLAVPIGSLALANPTHKKPKDDFETIEELEDLEEEEDEE